MSHRQVGVGHQDLSGPEDGQPSHPGLHRSVQTASRFGQSHGPVLKGPPGHFGVVADHGHRKRCRRLEHPGGHHPGQLGPRLSVEGRRQSGLSFGERLHRDENNTTDEVRNLGVFGRHPPQSTAAFRRSSSGTGAP